MAEKILYYLGAGASAQALPLAKSVWSNDVASLPPIPRIPGLPYELENFVSQYNLSGRAKGEDQQGIIKQIESNCKLIAKKASEFGDVDTYARYLHLKEAHPEFRQLKQSLSQYFSIKQTVLKARDSRYLPWLVSIMSKKTFPDNVKIVSWNYDFQVELAANFFGNPEARDDSGVAVSYTPSTFCYYPNLDYNFTDSNRLSLIHLNGIAGFGKRRSSDRSDSIFQKHTETTLGRGLKFITDCDLDNQVHFAWEDNDHRWKVMPYVEDMIAGTTILVVIGYSFPFFNRDVDKRIFKTLKDGGMRKIYYQDPVLNGHQLRAQFDLDDDYVIRHVSQTENFHIPFEY